MNEPQRPTTVLELLTCIWAGADTRDLARRERTFRRLSACELLTDDQKEIVKRLREGASAVAEVRAKDEWLSAVIEEEDHVDRDEDRFNELEARRNGTYRPTLWEYVAQQLSIQFTIPVPDSSSGRQSFEDRLSAYCCDIHHGKVPNPDQFTNEIPRLDKAGFADILLHRIWERYPDDAAALSLPEAKRTSAKQQQAAGKAAKSPRPRARRVSLKEATDYQALVRQVGLLSEDGMSLRKIQEIVGESYRQVREARLLYMQQTPWGRHPAQDHPEHRSNVERRSAGQYEAMQKMRGRDGEHDED